jgi:hypothetical protein
MKPVMLTFHCFALFSPFPLAREGYPYLKASVIQCFAIIFQFSGFDLD